MRRLPLLFVAILALMQSCAGGSEKKEDLAAIAAKSFYDSLVAGRYECFVDDFASNRRIPDGYREQLVANAKQFLARQGQDHQGIKTVSVVGSKVDSVAQITHVFLLLCFGDSTKEEILVPMVREGEAWMMK